MPTTSHVLCNCGVFMRVKKNGVTVEELMNDGAPYKLWDADMYQCPNCSNVVITGFASAPMAEHYQEDYAELRKKLEPIYPGN